MPTDEVLPSLKENESIRGVYHQFVLAYFWQWLGGAIVFLAPFFFLYLLLKWGVTGMVLLGVLLVIGLFWLGRTYRLWYGSQFIITTEKIMNISQLGFFDRTVSQILLDKINDVSYRKRGFWQTMFNYGALAIQVSASPEKLQIKNLRHPAAVQQALYDAQEESATKGIQEYSSAELLAIIREIRTRIGEPRWRQILKGNWKLKQDLIDEMGESDKGKAEAMKQFFSRKI